jgi:hypothetical protein
MRPEFLRIFLEILFLILEEERGGSFWSSEGSETIRILSVEEASLFLCGDWRVGDSTLLFVGEDGCEAFSFSGTRRSRVLDFYTGWLNMSFFFRFAFFFLDFLLSSPGVSLGVPWSSVASPLGPILCANVDLISLL